jgi:hypothetical protein
VFVISGADLRAHCTRNAWAHWFAENADQMAYPIEAVLETFLAGRTVVY